MTTFVEPSNAPYQGVDPHLMMSESHHGRGRTSVDEWVLGDGSWLMSFRYHGLAVSCPRNRRTDPSTRLLTMAVFDPGDWALLRHGQPAIQRADGPTLVGLDQSSAFDFRGHGDGSAVAVHITHARLTLAIETVRRGLEHLHPGLPMYPLALQHLQQLGVLAATSPQMLADLSASTIGVVRSLLISSADDALAVGAANDLITRIERYIDENIDQKDLGADTIAAAHNISVRQLYKIWPAKHGSLTGHIASRRLGQARTSLLTHQHLSIAAIAQKHGFTHPTHFTQRFRATYGVTPSGWRRRNQSLSR
ncbi:AraC family transcriptional regulator [Nocardia sp. 348MFTsu5.1]|uniref:AraC family transcriptional regulator n=1 Tax=Nocardia sp. 348MFTsu5.1 TaxID=1172185 RepID=UPI00037A3BA6|nr:AraC family transcriptional regulator [Nocardia sp. 348MFTsu5.1]